MDTARRTPATGDLPEEQALYRQFVEATQESVRLEAALKGFFLKTDMDPAPRRLRHIFETTDPSRRGRSD